MKVYIDDYNVMWCGTDDIPRGVGDHTNIIDWDLVKDTDWEACSYGKDYKPPIAEISEEDYAKFHDACETINQIIDKVYQLRTEYCDAED